MVWYSHLFQNFPQFIVILLRNLYAGQEATVRTGLNGTTDWFQIGKGVRQGCILSPCLFNFYAEFSSVQFSHSAVSNSLRPHELQQPGLPGVQELPWSSLKLTSIESVMPSTHLILCRPLLLLPPIPPCIRVFSNESTLHMRWPKYWSFTFSIIPSKEHPGLISSRMN